jgi:uncharacterized membrane protein YgcG
MKKILCLALIVFGLACAARAQDDVPQPMPVVPTFTDAQLDQLLGPVALYPDPLIAVMLPASTLPEQIVMADRYVSNGGDLNQMDPQTYDQNVIALAHYPDVLKWMDDNLNWTTQLGQAFANQQQGVMDSIQRLRTLAYNLGNLQSTPQIQVINDNGYIEILPASGSNLYVPDYQPAQVYYQQPYGPPFITFGIGFVIGPWLCSDFNWHNHQVICWNHYYPRPYNWWHQAPAQRQAYLAAGHAYVWNPNYRGGTIPLSQSGNHWGHPGDQHIVQYGNPVANSTYYGGNNPGNANANWNNHVGNNPGNPGANWNNHVNERDTHNWTPPILSQPAPHSPQYHPSNGRNNDDAIINGQTPPDPGSYNRGPQNPGNQPHSPPPSNGNWGGASHGSTAGNSSSGGNGGSHSAGGGSTGSGSYGGSGGSYHSSGGGSTSSSGSGSGSSGNSGGYSSGGGGGGGGGGRH